MRRFGAFLWDFIIGDDPLIAAGVVAGLGLTALLAGAVASWWVLAIVVAVVLAASVWRASRPSGGPSVPPGAEPGP